MQRCCKTALLITNSPKFCHISPVFIDPHLLPIKFRIDCKILPYSNRIMVNSNTKYNLRYSVVPRLKVANVRTLVTLGGRAFQIQI